MLETAALYGAYWFIGSAALALVLGAVFRVGSRG